MTCPDCRTLLTGRCPNCGRVKLGDGTEFNENDTEEKQRRDGYKSRTGHDYEDEED